MEEYIVPIHMQNKFTGLHVRIQLKLYMCIYMEMYTMHCLFIINAVCTVCKVSLKVVVHIFNIFIQSLTWTQNFKTSFCYQLLILLMLLSDIGKSAVMTLIIWVPSAQYFPLFFTAKCTYMMCTHIRKPMCRMVMHFVHQKALGA